MDQNGVSRRQMRAERDKRLALALRENLKRRKQQAGEDAMPEADSATRTRRGERDTD